ncbi:hypothetical protein RCH18_002852 [Flavobacterium sp. PL11]|jgi:hypothetical protein|uniref:DUF6146 family protein n=1 Tax=Flavobacterium sp. PL11 TaxID=3071717 RepID=UPI002DF986F8|nr:hypothetical protein [Flavobacterium sp. PL11]
MRNSYFIIVVFLCFVVGCSTTNSTITNKTPTTGTVSDTIRIENKELEYEVIIIDPGFSTWLASNSLPRNFHSQSYLENKNQLWIREWNSRVLQPNRYNPNLYEMTINYDFSTDYGYEVNYLIYNYMVYFQNTYKQKLFGYVPIR